MRRKKMKRRIKELEELAYQNDLTKLYNRRKLYEVLDNEIEQACYVLLDIDNFKAINDNYGHYIGDKKLIEFGQLLKELKCECFQPFHISGDEFFIIIKKTYRESLEIMKGLVNKSSIAFSYGLLEITDEHPTRKQLFKACDILMYSNKRLNKEVK